MNRLNWTPIAVIGLIVVLVIAFGVLALGGQWGGGLGMMGPGMMGGYGGGLFSWLLPLGFLILFGLGLIWFVQTKGKSETKGSDTALEILKRRYASGEISKKEYDQIKSDL